MPLRTSYPFAQSRIFWDAAIAVVLLACAALLTWGLLQDDATIGGVMIAMGSIGFLLTFYGSFVEPKRIHLNKKIIQLKELPDVSIAVASDFHVGPYNGKRLVERTVQLIAEAKPDLIFLPGDFVDSHRSRIADLEPLRALPSIAPCFAVVGNHDAGCFESWSGEAYTMPDVSSTLATLLRNMGVTVLRNQHQSIRINGKLITIAGIDDLYMRSCDLAAALDGIDASSPVILLSHNPDVILDDRSSRARLIVSGHTHGGQIRLPFIGSIAPIPDELGRKFDQGIFNLQSGNTLAVTHGLGESGVRARLWCVPEIMVLTVETLQR